jgi:hypothetical protein
VGPMTVAGKLFSIAFLWFLVSLYFFLESSVIGVMVSFLLVTVVTVADCDVTVTDVVSFLCCHNATCLRLYAASCGFVRRGLCS